MVEVHTYIDVSGSMTDVIDGMQKHDIRKKIWKGLTTEIEGHPSCITAFSGKGENSVCGPLQVRTKAQLDSLNIPEFNGWTYLWEYLVTEGRAMSGKAKDCMILLITDGIDTHSPGIFNGVDGLGPCVTELNKAGFETDFHIIGIGLDEDAIKVYEQFSGASGGRFWNIKDRKDLERVSKEAQQHLGIILKDPQSRAEESQRLKEEYSQNRKPGDIEVLPTTTTVGGTNKSLPVTRYRSRRPDDLQKWLESFVRSLGHELVRPEDSSIARVTSKFLHPGKKTRTRHDWWMIDAKVLDSMSEVDFLKLQLEVSESVCSKKHIIVVGMPNDSSGINKLENMKNVEIIIWPSGRISPAPKIIYNPWPPQYPLRWDPSPGGDWNAVPSDIKGKCRPGIVILPVVDCKSLHQNRQWKPHSLNDLSDIIRELHDQSFRPLLEEDCFENENRFEWEIDRDIGHKTLPESDIPIAHAWERVGNCFCDILRDGFMHVLNCYLSNEGKMNNTVVVELTEMGRLLRLDRHPCVKCFEKKINKLSEYGARNGWPEIMVSLRYS
ncbi:MAG: hypothetical protein OR994_05755 [Candidatus Poseidoniales archaeon]|nr:hypothetical protein [Candidatus Poseidoniales archaeon]